jgi:hypothetical protein
MAKQNVTVDPKHLRGLATTQDQSSDDMTAAINKTDGVSKRIWMSHGVYVGAANKAIEQAEAARKAAGKAVQAFSADLAKTLRTAVTAYAGTDDNAGENIDKQVLDR